jgi:hypothetical protein
VCWPGLRVHRHSEECEAEEISAREEVMRRHPATLFGVGDSSLPDMPRECSVGAPKGVAEKRCDHILGRGNPS